MRTRHPDQGPSALRARSAAAVRPRLVAPQALLALAVLFAAIGVGVGTATQASAAPVSFEVPFRCGEVWYGGTRAGHGNAIDFNQGWPDSIDETGVPVLASAAGRVTESRYQVDSEGYGWGWTVVIDHGSGWSTRYAHMYAQPLVGLWAQVEKGQHIGGVGGTPRYAPHLHYEQMLNGVTQAPTFRGIPYDLRYQSLEVGYQGERIVSQNGCGPVRVPNPCGGFWDTPTGGFCEQILWAEAEGITTGYGDGTFLPESAVSRQAMAAFLYRFVGATPGAAPSYRDVTVPHAFDDEIGWLQSTGLTQGYEDGTFRPTAPITRQALAAFLWRLAGTPTAAGGPNFSDVPSNHPFHEAITWMASSGLSTGWGDGTFRPDAVLSRQAMVTFLYRMASEGTVTAAADVLPAPTSDAAVADMTATEPVEAPASQDASTPSTAPVPADAPVSTETGVPTSPDSAGDAQTDAGEGKSDQATAPDGPRPEGRLPGTRLPEGVEVGVGAGDGGDEPAGPGEHATP